MAKIYFISALESHPWGGSEELWFGTALHLAGCTHEISASVRIWDNDLNRKKIAELSAGGIKILPRKQEQPKTIFERLLRRISKSRSQKDSLELFLRQELPNLVCISNGNYADGLWALELCQDLGIPYVSIVQANAEFLWPNDEQRERLVRVYQNARKVFCVSNANLELLKDQLACDLNNGEVIRNPFNVPFRCDLPWPTSEVLRLAFVARVEPDSKGHDLLFHALNLPELADLPISVSCFGRGNAEKGVMALAKRLKVDHRVSFHGQVSDIVDVYRSHQALILPSRYEGLPLAIIEAMLCGRPVITTNVSGNPELLEDNVTGFIAKATTAKEVALAIERAFHNRSKLEEMGKIAKAVAQACVPQNPCQTFAFKLLDLISNQ